MRQEIRRKNWYCFYHAEDDTIWQDRLFASPFLAYVALNEFFGLQFAYRWIRQGGWRMRKLTTVMRISPKSITK